MLDLNFADTLDVDLPAKLTDELSYEDLSDSQNQCISGSGGNVRGWEHTLLTKIS